MRAEVLALVDGAVDRGARLEACCKVLGISARSVQRWHREPAQDARRGPKTAPAHQLSQAEKDEVVRLVNHPDYRNLSPEQAIAKLASDGVYICSERSLRRILAERQLNRYRERSQPAKSHNKPRQYIAHEPLRVLSWDITYMRSATVRGEFFFLYLFLDIWSRRIVGAEVHATQQADLAAHLVSAPGAWASDRARVADCVMCT